MDSYCSVNLKSRGGKKIQKEMPFLYFTLKCDLSNGNNFLSLKEPLTLINSCGAGDEIPMNLIPCCRTAGSTIESESDARPGCGTGASGREVGSMDLWIRGVHDARLSVYPT